MTDYLQREALIGGYEAEAEAADHIGAIYAALAELVGALPSQIALFDNRRGTCWRIRVPNQLGPVLFGAILTIGGIGGSRLRRRTRKDPRLRAVPAADSGTAPAVFQPRPILQPRQRIPGPPRWIGIGAQGRLLEPLLEYQYSTVTADGTTIEFTPPPGGPLRSCCRRAACTPANTACGCPPRSVPSS